MLSLLWLWEIWLVTCGRWVSDTTLILSKCPSWAVHGSITQADSALSQADSWKCSGKVLTSSLNSLLLCSPTAFHPNILSVGSKVIFTFVLFSKDMVSALFWDLPLRAEESLHGQQEFCISALTHLGHFSADVAAVSPTLAPFYCPDRCKPSAVASCPVAVMFVSTLCPGICCISL